MPGKEVVPYIVGDCIQWLSVCEVEEGSLKHSSDKTAVQCALAEDGIFRVSGRKTAIDWIKSQYEKGARPLKLSTKSDSVAENEIARFDISTRELASTGDTARGREALRPKNLTPHDVAGVLKRFLNDLPNPLMTHRLFAACVKTTQVEDDADRCRCVASIVDWLPAGNRAVLRAIMHLLLDTLTYSEQNRMTVKNLSIVFGPAFLRSLGADTDPLCAAQETPAAQQFVTALLTYGDKIFTPPARLLSLAPGAESEQVAAVKRALVDGSVRFARKFLRDETASQPVEFDEEAALQETSRSPLASSEVKKARKLVNAHRGSSAVMLGSVFPVDDAVVAADKTQSVQPAEFTETDAQAAALVEMLLRGHSDSAERFLDTLDINERRVMVNSMIERLREAETTLRGALKVEVTSAPAVQTVLARSDGTSGAASPLSNNQLQNGSLNTAEESYRSSNLLTRGTLNTASGRVQSPQGKAETHNVGTASDFVRFATARGPPHLLRHNTFLLRDSSKQVEVELWTDAVRWYPVGSTARANDAQALPLEDLVGAEGKEGPVVKPFRLFNRAQIKPQDSNSASTDVPQSLDGPGLLQLYAYADKTVLRRQQSNLKRAASGDASTSSFGQKSQDFVRLNREQIVVKFRTLPDSPGASLMRAWADAIHEAIEDLVPSRSKRHLLVLINPASGPGKATQIWESIEDMFQLARIICTVVYTTGPKHATQICSGVESIPASTQVLRKQELTTLTSTKARHIDLDDDRDAVLTVASFDGIIVVSGDGLLQEASQGLLQHPEADSLRQRLVFGVIPGGSGNAVAASIGASRAADAAWTIVCGRCVPIDVLRIVLVRIPSSLNAFASGLAVGNHSPVEAPAIDPAVLEPLSQPFFGMLQFTWSVVAEIDRDSESNRWMGGLRFDFEGGFKVLGKPKRHVAALTMWPLADHWDDERHTLSARRSSCQPFFCPDCIASQADVSCLESKKLERPISKVGDYSYFVGTNLSMMATKVVGSKFAHFSDGAVDLVTAENLNRTNMGQVLLGLESGAFLENPAIRLQKPWAFVLQPEPGTAATAREYYSADGEYPFSNASVDGNPPEEWNLDDTAVLVQSLPAHCRLYRGDGLPPFLT